MSESRSFDEQLQRASQRARYDAAGDLANELVALLLVEERAATAEDQRAQLRERRRDVRARVAATDPGSVDAVTALLEDLGAQLHRVRGAEGP